MIQVQFFNLKQVHLLDGVFRETMKRDMDYLLSIDPDRFLHAFRLTVGLPSDAEPYGGWETPDCELRGHSLVHYLSACSLVFAATETQSSNAESIMLSRNLQNVRTLRPRSNWSCEKPRKYIHVHHRGTVGWVSYYQSGTH